VVMTVVPHGLNVQWVWGLNTDWQYIRITKET